MRIFVSAAEISSDLQAEKIIRSFISLYPNEEIELSGIGGPALRALSGFKVIERAENLRVMGFTEVLGRLSFIKDVKNRVLEHLRLNPPDLLITFDYPEFHLSLMKEVKQLPELNQTLKISGIPPKVWVWRQNRVERIRELYNGVWVIFPFEKKFYEARGIPVIYQGNPLISGLFKHQEGKAPLLTPSTVRLAVMPGSRLAELKRHLPLIPETLEKLSALLNKKVHAEVPIPAGAEAEFIRSELISNGRVEYAFFAEGSNQVLARNRLGLIKSGTSTLEAAVLGCVPIIFYRVSPISEWIFKFVVRYAGPIGLPNILLGSKTSGDSVFREFVGSAGTPEALAVELFHHCEDGARLMELQSKGESLKKSLVPHEDVPLAIAREMNAWLSNRPQRRAPRPQSVWLGLGSFVWSLVNGARRGLRRFLGLLPPKVGARSVLVGNLQAGGAGKTPFVIELAREAQRRGFRVGVVSRGYGGDYDQPFYLANPADSASKIGDEPLEILRSVPGISLGLSADRVRAARELSNRGSDFLIFDDGLQNLGFETDLKVILVTDLARNEILFRDFDSVVKQADLVFQTKGFDSPRFPSAKRLHWKIQQKPEQPIWILCGIADPTEVLQFYEGRGFQVQRLIALPDHTKLDAEAVKKLMKDAQSLGARLAVTEKDRVKLEGKGFEELLVLRRQLANPEVLDEIFDRLQ